MRPLIAVAIIIWVFQANLASATEDVGGKGEVVMAVWLSAKSCNPDVSQKVDLKVLIDNFDDYHNKCVTIEGYTTGRALFYRHKDAIVKYADTSDLTQGRRIGIYGSDETMKAWNEFKNGPNVRLTGKLWACDDLRGPDTIMVLGYCHYTDGPILGTSVIETAPKAK